MALAKTTRPSLAGAIARPRLFRHLDRARPRPVTWVWGPPGAGKTTLVASYLAARRVRTLWYQVDAGDGDLATFFYYLGGAAPRRRLPLPLLAPEYRADLDVFAREYFRRLYERLRPPFALVLDNYQDAPGEALLDEVVRAAAEELPRGGRIVGISRMEPPAALARLRLHQRLDALEWDELRLTAAEADGLARRQGRRRPAADVRRLHGLADGWIAGLLLLLGRGGGDAAPAAALGRSQVLFDYFAGEIFATREAEAREVLLQTALLPRVTAPLATALTGQASAGQIVAELHRQNYFVNRSTGSESTYQYHPLFREFLLAEGRRTIPPDRLATLQRSAAALLEGAGQVDPAADLLRDAADAHALAGLICRHAGAMIAQGRVETVEGWLAQVPEPVFAEIPWLYCWRGVVRMGRSFEDCLRDSEAALHAHRRAGDVDGMLLAWSLIVVAILMSGRPDESLDPWIALIDELLRECERPPSPDVDARVATAMILAIAWRQPHHPGAARWAERALTSTERHADLVLRSYGALGWYLYQQFHAGDTAKASIVIPEMRALMRRRDVPSLVALHAAVPVAWYEAVCAAPTYRETVNDVLALARSTGLRHALTTSVLSWGCLAALGSGDVETVGPWLARYAVESEALGPVYRLGYQVTAAMAAFVRRELDVAARHWAETERQGFAGAGPWDELLIRAMGVHLLCALGRVADAAAQLARSRAIAAGLGAPYFEWVVGLAEADLRFAQGRDADGLGALRAALARARAGGFVSSQISPPAVMARLCARALDAGIEVPFVRELVERRRLVPESPALDVEAWPWPLRVHTLGRFAVLREDRRLRFTGKVQRKPLAVLKAIVALGTPNVREDQVMDALWPDADGDAARRALTSAVFRLRRLLGDERAVIRADGELGLDPARCWVDAWVLERLLGQAEAALGASTDGAASDVMARVRRLGELYQGHFLGAPDDADWSGERAGRIHRRLLRHLHAVAARLRAAGADASDLLELARRVDPAASARLEPAVAQVC